MRNKRGNYVANVIWIVLVAVIFFIAGVTIYNSTSQGDILPSLGGAVNLVISGVQTIFIPIFNAILGLKGVGSSEAFLRILAFILLSIIIVGTMDSINIFGEDKKGKATNFFIGIIVGIIGVRFMPDNLWQSLTAPSSALMATILMGLPFLAMFFITMKVNRPLVSKLAWLFFLILTVYLIAAVPNPPGIDGVYLSFAGFAAIMMFFDAGVRRFFYREQAKKNFIDVLHKKGLLQKNEFRKELEKWEEIYTDPKASKEEQDEAKGMIDVIEEAMKKAST